MDFLTYLLVSVASFLGLYAGAALAFIAPEEMKPGRKYFFYMRKMLSMALILCFAYFIGMSNIVAGMIIAVLGVIFIFLTRDMLVYPMLGLLFYASLKSPVLFEITAVMIFLIGLPVGTMFVAEHGGMKKHKILAELFMLHCAFFVLALPFYFIRI